MRSAASFRSRSMGYDYFSRWIAGEELDKNIFFSLDFFICQCKSAQ